MRKAKRRVRLQNSGVIYLRAFEVKLGQEGETRGADRAVCASYSVRKKRLTIALADGTELESKVSVGSMRSLIRKKLAAFPYLKALKASA